LGNNKAKAKGSLAVILATGTKRKTKRAKGKHNGKNKGN